MNKSYLLMAPDAVKFITSNDKNEAQIYLAKEYPGIVYDAATDSYEYRGIKFDYFKAGRSDHGDSYILVDQKDSGLWLFTYGDKEERWLDYLRSVAARDKIEIINTKSAWDIFWGIFKG